LIKIKNIVSTDVEDKLYAFVGEEVRGVQYVQYIKELDAYMVFMDIYSDVNKGDSVTFKIWDASAGIIYSDITPTEFIFESNTLVGSVASPQIFNTNQEIAVDIPLTAGWNWISHFLYNVDSTNITKTLESINSQQGDEIKGQKGHSDFTPSNGWTGILGTQAIRPEQLYKLKVAEDGILTIKGDVINPESRTIDLADGWNWIGFISIRNQSVAQALGNLNPADGDLIKGKSQFAIYDSFLGWIGSLQTMIPSRGYMYRSTGQKSFVYPLAGGYKNFKMKTGDFNLEHWPVSSANYSSNMTVMAALDLGNCDVNLQEEEFAIGIFDQQGTTRSVAEIKQIENKEYCFFTIGGDDAQDLSFKILNPNSNEEISLNDKIGYEANQHVGGRSNPLNLTISGEVCKQLNSGVSFKEIFMVYPSVFDDYLTVNYQAQLNDDQASISIRSMLGTEVAVFDVTLTEGHNTIELDFDGLSIASGIYFIELNTYDKSEIIKIIKE